MIDLAGQTIAGYRVESLVGVVGTVEVYRGVHTELDRPAAIKIIRADLALNPDFVERFVEEAHAIVPLRHPNIVEVYDFGDQDGRFYFVMEWLKDGTLRTLLQRRQSQGEEIDLPFGVDLVRQAALGLEFAHDHKIVHGDLKPDNLFLQRSTPTTYTLKVSDFGLARLVEAGAATVTDVIMGSLAYMSPERLQGEEHDARSDIYSLGVVLYELVTGYLPFEAKTVDEALYKHSHTDPPPPSEIVPQLPSRLEELILLCLEKRPEDRFQSMAALATALESLVAPLQPAPPIPSPDRATDNLLLTTIPVPRRAVPDPPADRFVPPPEFAARDGLSRLHLLDRDGQRLESVDLSKQRVSVGRASDNDVVLQDDAVSRYHLRLDIDEQGARVTDVGSTNGTLLAGTPLTPNATVDWEANQWIYVSPFWLWLDLSSRAAAPASPHPAVAAAPRPEVAQAAPERIRLGLDAPTLAITPGQLAVVMLTLANVGRLVDHFALTVEGIPSWWVQGLSRQIRLNPGQQTTVPLNILVPESPGNLAGDYAVVVRARSQENPAESGTAQAVWTVARFAATALDLAPKRRAGWRSGSYLVTLENQGNATEHYALDGSDDEQKLSYGFSRGDWILTPGTAVRVPMRLRAPIRWIGTKQRQVFMIEAKAARDGSVQTARGDFDQRAIIPIWLLPLLLLLLVGLAFLIRYLATPSKQLQVTTWTVQPLTVNVGTPVTITWSVRNAQEVWLGRQVTGDPHALATVQRVGFSGSATDFPRRNVRYGIGASKLPRRHTPGLEWQYVRVLPPLTPTSAPTPTAAPTATAAPSKSSQPGGAAAGSGSAAGKKTSPAAKPTAAAPKPTSAPKPTAAPKPTSAPKPTHAPPKPTVPPRPKPTPTARPTPKPTLPPASAALKNLLGNWGNINTHAQDGALVKLPIAQVSPNTVSMHAFYACGTKTCDWGTQKVKVPGGSATPKIIGKFPVNGGFVTITVQRVGSHLLHALVVHHVNGCTMCLSQNAYLIRSGSTAATAHLLPHPHLRRES